MMPAGIVRITIIEDGKVIGRDAQIIPADKALTEFTVPVTYGKRTAEIRIEFDPAVSPDPVMAVDPHARRRGA